MSKKIPKTSHKANESMTKKIRDAHIEKIILALYRMGNGIYSEIANYANMEKNQVSRRIKEIETRDGMKWIKKTGKEKKTLSNRLANEYTLTESGKKKALQLINQK